jgi:general secretion pathway protein K
VHAINYIFTVSRIKDQKGMALVVTLLALAIITALVVEFSYAVYTGTQDLYNWRDLQRLSLMAESGINVSERLLIDKLRPSTYSYPGYIELPVENPFEDFKGVITVRIEDESSKFNVNTIISPNGNLNTDAFKSFKKLLENLSLNEQIADRIADFIDPDSEARLPDSEAGAKNSDLESIDEILLIKGISRKDYNTLLPYITVYGKKDFPVINVNGAEAPVLMCILDNAGGDFPINEDLAERIIKYRESTPFEDTGKFNNFAGTGLGKIQIMVKGTDFYIRSTAESGGLKRIIETVINTDNSDIEYWKEY